MKAPGPVTVLVIGVALFAAVFIFLLVRRSRAREEAAAEHEGFTGLAAGSVDNVGTLEDAPYAYRTAIEENAQPVVDYADVVSDGHDYVKDFVSPTAVEGATAPMARLDRLQGAELMPRVSSTVTPFAIDVANPSSHKYMVSAPAVSSLKSRYRDYSLSNMIRGDIPIKMDPNIPLITKTFQDRDALRLDGLFAPSGFDAMYDKYTGTGTDGGAGFGTKNFVTHVAGAGSGAGAQGETIMDNY